MDVPVGGVGETLERATRLKVALRVVLHILVGLGLELPLQTAVGGDRRAERRAPGCQQLTRVLTGGGTTSWFWEGHLRNTLTFEKTASACWYAANPVSITCMWQRTTTTNAARRSAAVGVG